MSHFLFSPVRTRQLLALEPAGRAWIWIAALSATWILSTPVVADTHEASIRPYLEYRRGQAPEETERTQAVNAMGGGVLMSYGLTFSLSLTARYGVDTTGKLQTIDESNGSTKLWTQWRHQMLFGLAYTPSDELTPLFQFEAGPACRVMTDRHELVFDRRDAQRGTAVEPDLSWFLLARASIGLEWRFRDFWSVTPTSFVDYRARGLGFGGGLMLSAYRYL